MGSKSEAAALGKGDCPICDTPVLAQCLSCSKCKQQVHLKCSKLPVYQIIWLQNTRTFFTCEQCVQIKYVDMYSDLVETCEQQMKAEPCLPETEPAGSKDVGSAPAVQPDPEDGGQIMDLGGSPSAAPLSQNAGVSTSGDSAGDGEKIERSVQHHERRPERSTKICYHYRRGTCKFGRRGLQCKYSHPDLCFKFKMHGLDERKGCPANANCGLMHPILCRKVKQSGVCNVVSCKFFHPKHHSRYAKPNSRPESSPGMQNGQKNEREINDEVRDFKQPELSYAKVTASRMPSCNQQPIPVNDYFLDKMAKDFSALRTQMQQLTELVHGRLSVPGPVWAMGQGNNPLYQMPPRIM